MQGDGWKECYRGVLRCNGMELGQHMFCNVTFIFIYYSSFSVSQKIITSEQTSGNYEFFLFLIS